MAEADSLAHWNTEVELNTDQNKQKNPKCNNKQNRALARLSHIGSGYM